MKIIFEILVKFKIDRILFYVFEYFPFVLKLKRYELKSGQKINFVSQGGYSLNLMGDLSKFKIATTSHLKSDTNIECTGGVEIGEYFHTGRGLTIFSANHNWKGATKIPYDEKVIHKKVIIENYVWCGANVMLLPGVTVGEGAIIAGGSVVVNDLEKQGVYGGNPAKLITYRDKENFERLKNNKMYY